MRAKRVHSSPDPIQKCDAAMHVKNYSSEKRQKGILTDSRDVLRERPSVNRDSYRRKTASRPSPMKNVSRTTRHITPTRNQHSNCAVY